jgi:hypothetical protein
VALGMDARLDGVAIIIGVGDEFGHGSLVFLIGNIYAVFK